MHGLDTEKQVFCYEHEFYVFSNFSSFSIEWKGKLYMTSEHVYHSEKFHDEVLKEKIRNTRSAHDSFKLSRLHADECRKDWNEIKVLIMKEILWAKVQQHPYVKRSFLNLVIEKLLKIPGVMPSGVGDPKRMVKIVWENYGWRSGKK